MDLKLGYVVYGGFAGALLLYPHPSKVIGSIKKSGERNN